MTLTEEKDILSYALENGIIDLDTIQKQIEMNERKKYLAMHTLTKWQGKNGLWYTYLPKENNERKLVKRRTEEDIDDCIIEHYKGVVKAEKESKIVTLEMIFPVWLKFKQSHTDASSYIYRITKEWQRFYANDEIIKKPMDKLTKLYLDEWAHNKIKENNLTKKAYYNMTVIIRQCFEYAVEAGYVEENTFARVKINTKLFVRSKKKSASTQVYTQYEEQELINDMFRRFVENPTNTAPLAVILSFELGTRIGEMCALKFSDIEGNYINIQRQEVRDYEFVDGTKMKFKGFRIVEYAKTDDGERQIYLTSQAKEIIELVRKVNEQNNEHYEDFIFVKGGSNINHYSIQAMILRGCEKVDILIKTSHKIRKTYVSKLIDSGLNIDAIRRMVGHADEKTTLSCYCFNRLTETETEEIIENALNGEKVIIGNQKIINFLEMKKPQNTDKISI